MSERHLKSYLQLLIMNKLWIILIRFTERPTNEIQAIAQMVVQMICGAFQTFTNPISLSLSIYRRECLPFSFSI